MQRYEEAEQKIEQPKAPRMTMAHYEFLAAQIVPILRSLRQIMPRQELEVAIVAATVMTTLSHQLKATNPNYNCERFVAAMNQALLDSINESFTPKQEGN